MKHLLMGLTLVGVCLAGYGQRAEAAILHEIADPALSGSASKTATTLSVTLVEGAPWSEVKLRLYSDYYYSSGNADWTCHTRLASDSSVQIAALASEARNLGLDEVVFDTLDFSSGQTHLAGYSRYKDIWSGWSSPSYSGPFGGGSLVSGYLGLRLQNGADTHYGWMRLDVTGSTTQTVTIHEWAVNLTPNQPIQVAQVVPEPASLAVLLAGVAPLLRRRR